jgi:hypothetical protein
MDERAKQWMIDAAEKKYTCAKCMKAKAEKALRVSQELPSKIFQNLFGFTTDLLTKTFSVDPFWDHTP